MTYTKDLEYDLTVVVDYSVEFFDEIKESVGVGYITAQPSSFNLSINSVHIENCVTNECTHFIGDLKELEKDIIEYVKSEV